MIEIVVLMPRAVDNDQFVLTVVEDLVRGGQPPTVTNIADRIVPKGRDSVILELFSRLFFAVTL